MKGRSDNQNLYKGTIFNLAGKLFGRGINVFTQVFLARILGPYSFGLFAIGWSSLNLFGLFSTLGIDRGVIKFSNSSSSNRIKTSQIVYQSLGMSILFAGILAVLFYSFSSILAIEFFGKPDLEIIFRYLSICFFPFVILKIISSATRVTMNMRYSLIIEDMIQPISCLIIFSLLCYFISCSIEDVLISFIISFFLAVIIGLYFIYTIFFKGLPIQFKGFFNKDLLIYSLSSSLADSFTLYATQFDKILVGYFLLADQAGIYQASTQTSVIFSIILGAFSGIFTPMISNLFHSGNIDRINQLFKSSTKWSFLLSVPVFVPLFVFSDSFLRILFGEAFEEGQYVLRLIAIGQIINASTGAVGPLFIMTNNQNIWLKISSFSLALSLCLNIFLIPRFGLIGSGVSLIVTILFLFISGLIILRKKLNLWPYDKTFIPGLFYGVFLFMFFFIIKYYFEVDDFFSLCVCFLGSYILYFVLLIFVWNNDPEIDAIRNKIIN